MGGIRVLVVDDSAFARKVVREILGRDSRIEVVGFARDGLEALEKIQELRPDVVTLDLMMPHLDGIGVLGALRPGEPPRVVVVSISDSQSEIALDALALGAVDLVTKPTALATDRLYELGDELVAKVVAAAGARPARLEPPAGAPAERPPAAARATPPSTTELVVVGTSTGGPQALTRLLRDLPAGFPVPIAIALHIPADYTEALAARLDGQSDLEVVEARDRTALVPGRAVLAAGGRHLAVSREGDALVARTSVEPVASLYVPSVDLLFDSAARACGAAVLAVVMTGMGDDGLAGARAVVRAGGRVLTEAEASCVVYGMPRVVDEAGLSSGRVPLEHLAAAVAVAVGGHTR